MSVVLRVYMEVELDKGGVIRGGGCPPFSHGDDPLILKVTNCLGCCSTQKGYSRVVVHSPSESKINEDEIKLQ